MGKGRGSILPTAARSSDCCWSTQSVSERGASPSEVWATGRAVAEEMCAMGAVWENWSGWSKDLRPVEGETLAVGLVERSGAVVEAALPAVALRPAPAVVAVAGCLVLGSVAAAAAGVAVG